MKRRQVDGEREHPEERDGGDVRGDVGGGAEEQARRHEGEGRPPDAAARRHPLVAAGQGRRRGVGLAVRAGGGGRGRAAPDHQRARDDQRREDQVAQGPEPRLRDGAGTGERQPRLDEHRIAQQREQAAEIARRIEEVRVAGGAVARVREPVLEHRRGGAHHEEGQAHRRREEDQHVERRCALAAPEEAEVEAQRQHGERQREQRDVQDGLARGAEPRAARVGVRVAGEERGLEEHHAGAPHRRGAAEERQDHLAGHRLHHEQEGGADEQGERVEQQDGGQEAPPGRGSRARPGIVSLSGT